MPNESTISSLARETAEKLVDEISIPYSCAAEYLEKRSKRVEHFQSIIHSALSRMSGSGSAEKETGLLPCVDEYDKLILIVSDLAFFRDVDWEYEEHQKAANTLRAALTSSDNSQPLATPPTQNKESDKLRNKLVDATISLGQQLCDMAYERIFVEKENIEALPNEMQALFDTEMTRIEMIDVGVSKQD